MVPLAFIMGKTSTDSIDSSSPLFLHPSDIPGISLVHMPIFCSGFDRWKMSIVVFFLLRIRSHLLMVYILNPMIIHLTSKNTIDIIIWSYSG